MKTANRPAKRKQWTLEQMTAAIEAYRSGSSPSINQAARDHGVPPTTLKDRISGHVLHGSKPGQHLTYLKRRNLSCKSILSTAPILDMEKLGSK